MKRIGLLSDTHGHIHKGVYSFFKSCDEIWHAGDIGNIETADTLSKFKPLRAVYGNIDGGVLRSDFQEFLHFKCEDVGVLMIHIGGYPGRYESKARKLIELYRPGIFISGHSHILKVINDPKYKLLHINPGASGSSGFHKLITMIRFTIEGEQIKDMVIFEANR